MDTVSEPARRVLFLFVGEPHHVFHALPVAAEMASLCPDLRVEVAVAERRHLRSVRAVRRAYPGFDPPIRLLQVPRGLRWLHRCGVMGGNARVARLAGALRWLRQFDAIVIPERSTTILRPLLPRRTRLAFTPHGAGDRAVMLDRRDRHFDFVLVAGQKSERRLLEAGLIRPGRYAVNGYVKLDLLRRLAPRARPLFRNGRPVVLYAPHFRPELSSWERHGLAVVEAFRAQSEFNLVVAPHVRLFHDAPAALRRALEALAVEDHILVDLGSDRLFDMTYTLAADYYVGDVSSQVYEFIARPRPCVFLNSHRVAWQGDPNYRFWKLGDVVDHPDALLPALRAARTRHAGYVAEQRAALAESVGGDPAGAARRGAQALAQFLADG